MTMLSETVVSHAIGVPENVPVLSPTGWKRLDTLHPGDEVIGLDGIAVRVRRVLTSGVGQLLQLTVRDGSQLTLGADQPIPVEVGPQRLAVTLPARRIAELNAAGLRLRVAASGPVQLPHAELLIDPYVLGVALGDAHLSHAGVEIWSNEPHIVGRVARSLPPGTRLSNPHLLERCTGWRIVGEQRSTGNPALVAFRKLDLLGKRSWQKFVPPPYLWASVDARLALLQGLLDTDGSVDQGRVRFSSASSQLAHDVAHLVHSLGGRATTGVRTNVTYSVAGEPGLRPGRDSYKVALRMRGDVEVFSLPRKVQGLRPEARPLLWNITDVRMAGVAPLVAVELENPLGTLVVGDGWVPILNASTNAVAAAQAA